MFYYCGTAPILKPIYTVLMNKTGVISFVKYVQYTDNNLLELLISNLIFTFYWLSKVYVTIILLYTLFEVGKLNLHVTLYWLVTR